jgi:selenocysteine-specific elongation factor
VPAAPAPTVVIGTAGHIDHGKTSLLRALTGIDADRLPEERERGMTIDVGYAHLTFDDGVELDFVDVPGHDKLIGNMLVGAGEIDAALLVVAADDGPRPQTLEHLQLLDALGIADGLAVITKTDLVEEERVAEVAAQVRALLEATLLRAAPVVTASSSSGDGIDEVRIAVRELLDAVSERRRGSDQAGRARLAIDRAFAVKGRGVVVTGTLRGGGLKRGATLRRQPGGEHVRIREIQVHNLARDRHEGGRTALNLAGLSAADLRRGDVLTTDAHVRPADRLLVETRQRAALEAADGSAGPPARPPARPPRTPRAGAHLRLHLGTDQVDAAVRRVPGDPEAVVLDLAREVAAFPGARGVLREPASGAVVAGIRVLDTRPPRGASRRRLTPGRVAGLRAAMDAAPSELDRAVESALIELHGALVVGGGDGQGVPRSLALASDVRAALDAAALEAVAAHHREAPVSAGLPLPRVRAAVLRRLRSLATIEGRDLDLLSVTVAGVVNELVASGRLLRRDDLLRDPALGGAPSEVLTGAMDRLERALDVPAPPALAEAAQAASCPPEGIRALQSAGRIVRLGPDLAWSTRAFHRLAAAALDGARVAPLTPAAFRDTTGTSRKYVLAILEDLDRREILRRTPEGHIPGKRAPRPGPEA